MWAQVNGNEVVRTLVHPIDMEVDGVTHPKSIFSKWSADDLKNIGVYPYRENSVDNRYHYSKSGNVPNAGIALLLTPPYPPADPPLTTTS